MTRHKPVRGMQIVGGQYWDVSWSPIRGCSHASPGCDHCWAERMAGRFCKGPAKITGRDEHGNYLGRFDSAGPSKPFYGFATAAGWTGRVELIESELVKPIHWKKPRVVALNWMGDLFHERVPDAAIDQVFAVMALCPQHRFLVLTKRAKRMREWFTPNRWERVRVAAKFYVGMQPEWDWPLSNVGLGVSVEDQARADERIPDLLATPAAMRFVSLEPLLGAVDVMPYLTRCDLLHVHKTPECRREWLDWVIVGGESGPGARPMPPEWARAIRDQCIAAGVPYFHKQNGEWATTPVGPVTIRTKYEDVPIGDGLHHRMFLVGKRAAGRLLDGRTWDQMPEG